MNEKVVLICEKTNHQLNIIDKNNYVFEGIFAVFDKENVNHRIYEWNEYKPHLTYLQEKIAKNKLVGELDHPEKFDISLQKVSHIIEKLWYDEGKNVLMGRIRLLDTDPNGMNARKLADAGFPLSISSRAAGTVMENKKVKIQRVFCFDIVADGGFGNDAELSRVNESLGFDVSQYTREPNYKMLNESLNITDNNIKIYDVTDKYPQLLSESADYSVFDYSIVRKDNKLDEKKINETEIYNKNANNMEKDIKNFVSIDEMHKYSLHVKEEINNLEKTLQEISKKISSITENNSTTSDEKVNALTEEIEKLKENSSALNKKMDTVYEWSDTISKDHNMLVAYAEKIAEDHNHLVNYTEAIAEDHNHLANYAEAIVEDHNHLANYAEKIAEDHNYVAAYVDEKIRPLLENTINYAEMVAEKANLGLNYVEDVVVNELHKTQSYVNDVLVEKLNTLWNYTDYLSEKANEVTSYAAYLGENAAAKHDLENVIGYAEHIAESVNTNETSKINESTSTSSTKYNNLNEKIDNLLSSIKTEKINESNFTNRLNKEQQLKFNNFNQIQKEQVANTIVTNNLNESQIQEMFESIENPKTPEERWLSSMPEDIKPLWENASAEVKERIFKNAALYNFNNDYAIKHYWNSKIDLLSGNNVTTLNENVNTEIENDEKVNTLGYSSDYVKNIFNRF